MLTKSEEVPVIPSSAGEIKDWEKDIAAARADIDAVEKKDVAEVVAETKANVSSPVSPDVVQSDLEKVMDGGEGILSAEQLRSEITAILPRMITGNAFFTCAMDELQQRFEKFVGISKEESDALTARRDPEYLRFLWFGIAQGKISENVIATSSILTAIKKRLGVDLRTEYKRNVSDNRITQVSNRGEMSGKAARLAVIASLRGLTRVYLYNSGFSILLRSFELRELIEFFNSVKMQEKELGRMVGKSTFYLADIFLRAKFMELLPQAIEDSSFDQFRDKNGIRDTDALIRNISAADYDVCVGAILTLMYRSTGYTMDLVCGSNKCDFKERNVVVDVAELRQDRLSLLTPEQIAFVHNTKEAKSEVDLIAYRNSLSFTRKTIEASPRIHYDMIVPTMDQYLLQGEKLVTRILTTVQTSRSINNGELMQEYLRTLDKMFIAWIGKVSIFDANGELTVATTDEGAILESLVDVPYESGPFRDEAITFATEAQVSIFCYTAIKCPKCGAEPLTGSIDEFVPVDVTFLFFDRTYRRLNDLPPVSTDTAIN